MDFLRRLRLHHLRLAPEPRFQARLSAFKSVGVVKPWYGVGCTIVAQIAPNRAHFAQFSVQFSEPTLLIPGIGMSDREIAKPLSFNTIDAETVASITREMDRVRPRFEQV